MRGAVFAIDGAGRRCRATWRRRSRWLRAHGDRGRPLSPAGELPRRAADRRGGDRSRARLDDDAARARDRRPGRRRCSPRSRSSERALPAIRADVRDRRHARPPRARALTGLRAGTPVAVGTGDDFANPLGAGVVAPGSIVCAIGTAEVVGALVGDRRCSIAIGAPSRWSRPTRIRPARSSSRTRAGCRAARCAGRCAARPARRRGARRARGDRTARRRWRDVHPRARRRDDAGVATARARHAARPRRGSRSRAPRARRARGARVRVPRRRRAARRARPAGAATSCCSAAVRAAACGPSSAPTRSGSPHHVAAAPRHVPARRRDDRAGRRRRRTPIFGPPPRSPRRRRPRSALVLGITGTPRCGVSSLPGAGRAARPAVVVPAT